MTVRSLAKILVLGALLPLLASCGDSTSAPVPTRIVVSPGNVTMNAVGSTEQFTAVLEDEKGLPIQGATFQWSVIDGDVATVSAQGLVTATGAGATDVMAAAQGFTGKSTVTVDPVPTDMVKIQGDAQIGAMSQPLAVSPTVEVRDANGNPVKGIAVTFAVLSGEGSVSSGLVNTGSDGRASTVWRLGCSNTNPQELEANYAGIRTVFSATADLSLPAICQETVPDGRAELPYSTTLEVAGGDPGSMTWSIASGALPGGITLQTDGTLAGTPTQPGSLAFTVRAQDGQGASATREFQMTVCEAPLDLDPGEATSFYASSLGSCGFFLPSGDDGDRYRIGTVYVSANDEDESNISDLTLSLSLVSDPTLSASEIQMVPFPALIGDRASPAPSVELSASFLESVAQAEANEALHRRMRAAERELMRERGSELELLPDHRSLARVSGPQMAAPEKIRVRTPSDFTSCGLGSTTTAVKIAENDHLVIYQDSTQNASSPLGTNYANQLLAHYRDYGKPVLDNYFGGLPDINSDGQVVLLVTPVVDDEEGVAFVWSADFFSASSCPASNEMELMRFSLSFIEGIGQGNYQAIGTVVHEAQHVSALYNGIQRGELQPVWVGEGEAEIAAEVASRLAWADAGGPAMGEAVEGSDITAITAENYRILLVMFRTAGYLSSQPNALTVNSPQGASSRHSYYGSGWHFHRWLGDAYGNAATPQADATLFRTLNEIQASTGVPGFLNYTGKASWGELLGEYAAAVMLNGTGAPRNSVGFTTYDFVGLNQGFNYSGKPSGDYPWPVNTFGSGGSTAFGTVTYTGTLGPGGLRVYDFTSTGTGLGMEVHGSASRTPLRMTVVRIQ